MALKHKAPITDFSAAAVRAGLHELQRIEGIVIKHKNELEGQHRVYA